MNLSKSEFGKTPENKQVYAYTLSNDNNVSVKIINYGATIVSINAPYKHAEIDDVVLGYDSLDGYLQNPANFGSTIGRFCNRIAYGKFNLEGIE